MSEIMCAGPKCGKAIVRRTDRSHKLKGGPRQRYCSPRCRTAAHWHNGKPSNIEDNEQQANWPNGPTEIIAEKGAVALQILRTCVKARSGALGYPNGAKAAVAHSYGRHPKAILDSVYPGMWRAGWPDGRVSDMANISRVNDAIACFLERQ